MWIQHSRKGCWHCPNVGCPQGTALCRSIPSCINVACYVLPLLFWDGRRAPGLTHPPLPEFFLLRCASHLKNSWDTHLFLEPEDMKFILQSVWSQAVVQDLDKWESSWKSRRLFCKRKVQILGQRRLSRRCSSSIYPVLCVQRDITQSQLK